MAIFTVATEDIMGENYELTKIECSDYNPNIDDSITLTIILTDVYDDPIDGENVTVTASEGTFTQLNGSDITSASSVTGTTNSSGQFTLTYNCSEWGLITFTANNKTTQVKVGGYKTTTPHNNYTLYDVQFLLRDPLQAPLGAVGEAAGEAIGVEQVHILPFQIGRAHV